MAKCDNCNGDGEFYCKCCNQIVECRECNGTGRETKENRDNG